MADPLNRGPESSPPTLRQELSVILAPRNGLVICALVSATLLVGEHVLLTCRMAARCGWMMADA